MFNVIIRSVHLNFFCFTDNIYLASITPTIILVRVSMKLSFEDKESFKEAVRSLQVRFNHPPSDPNSTRRLGVGSSSSMPLQDQDQERNEDICFNNPPGDPTRNTLRRMGSSSSMPPQERSEDIEMVQRSHSSLY
jgi:hypothetical protein